MIKWMLLGQVMTRHKQADFAITTDTITWQKIQCIYLKKKESFFELFLLLSLSFNALKGLVRLILQQYNERFTVQNCGVRD